MRAGNVDIVDDTFVRASPAAVRAALDGTGDLAAAARWLADGLDGTR